MQRQLSGEMHLIDKWIIMQTLHQNNNGIMRSITTLGSHRCSANLNDQKKKQMPFGIYQLLTGYLVHVIAILYTIVWKSSINLDMVAVLGESNLKTFYHK